MSEYKFKVLERDYNKFNGKSGDEQAIDQLDNLIIGYYNFDPKLHQLYARKSNYDAWRLTSTDGIPLSPNEMYTEIDIGFINSNVLDCVRRLIPVNRRILLCVDRIGLKNLSDFFKVIHSSILILYYGSVAFHSGLSFAEFYDQYRQSMSKLEYLRLDCFSNTDLIRVKNWINIGIGTVKLCHLITYEYDTTIYNLIVDLYQTFIDSLSPANYLIFVRCNRVFVFEFETVVRYFNANTNEVFAIERPPDMKNSFIVRRLAMGSENWNIDFKVIFSNFLRERSNVKMTVDIFSE